MFPSFNTIPSLRLRKDIWTQFPVCLIRLPQAVDGRDRYAIQWHQKNLSLWGQNIPQYSTITQIRLMKALATCDRWTIERPQRPGDLCVIAMRVPEEKECNPPSLTTPESIDSIEDLKGVYPICWKSQKNRHTLEFHNTQVRALAQSMGIDEIEVRQRVLTSLLPALKQSGWTLEPKTKTHSSEICVIYK